MSSPPVSDPEPSILSIEQVDEIISRLSAGKRQVPFFAQYRPVEGEPGIYELLDDAGKVVAWADEEGIHQLEEARRRPPNSLPRLYGRGAQVRILPDRLEVRRP